MICTMNKEVRNIDGVEYILKYIESDGNTSLYVYDKDSEFMFSISGEYDTDTENDFIREFVKCNGINILKNV